MRGAAAAAKQPLSGGGWATAATATPPSTTSVRPCSLGEGCRAKKALAVRVWVTWRCSVRAVRPYSKNQMITCLGWGGLLFFRHSSSHAHSFPLARAQLYVCLLGWGLRRGARPPHQSLDPFSASVTCLVQWVRVPTSLTGVQYGGYFSLIRRNNTTTMPQLSLESSCGYHHHFPASSRATLPAEFKHINKRRKRNQQGFP
jgi:hypothetical protein